MGVKKWHVMYTRPKFEKKINHKLEQKGIQSYLPLQVELRQWHDRKKKVIVPVFPGYVFVKIDAMDMYDIYNIPGFVRFISTGNSPDIIPDDRMQLIQRVLSTDFEKVQHFFAPNEKVRVVEGPFSGLEGTLVGERQANRLAVKIDIIDQTIVVNIDSALLERVERELVTV